LNVAVLHVMVLDVMVLIMVEGRPAIHFFAFRRAMPGPRPTDHTPNAGAGRRLVDAAKFVARCKRATIAPALGSIGL
jgi:hypothetical protein